MTPTQLRASFWESHPDVMRNTIKGKPAPQNKQPCDTRAAWVDFVDAMARAGTITDSLAQRATL